MLCGFRNDSDFSNAQPLRDHSRATVSYQRERTRRKYFGEPTACDFAKLGKDIPYYIGLSCNRNVIVSILCRAS